MRPLPGEGHLKLTGSLLTTAMLWTLTACYPPLPGAGGAQAAAAKPGASWNPPASAVNEARESRLSPDSFPPELERRRTALTTTDLINLALERSRETRATWLTAKAAAAMYGNALSILFPDITGSLAVTSLKTAATGGRVSVEQTTYGPAVTLNWLLLDFGGRAGTIDAARQSMFAANWTHNATLTDLVRRTAQGYYAYVGARGTVAADSVTLEEQRANLSAADDRHSVGVATIVDVLQARTAVAQALLTLEQAQGALTSARGALATLIGLSPSASFDVDTTEASGPVAQITETVDSLMAIGLLDRADLAAERAEVDVRLAQARSARSQYLPSLSATGTAGTTWVTGKSGNFPSYTIGLELAVPIFNGFGWQYAAQAAALTADAERAHLNTMEQQTALQVFQTYQQLRSAAQSVATADDLFTSASAAVDAARERYRQGLGSLLDLLVAQNALADSRSQRIQTRTAWHTSLVQLAHDAGLLQPGGATQLHLTPGGNR